MKLEFDPTTFLDGKLDQLKFVVQINPQAPVTQKVAHEVVFRRFQGEGVEFFLIGPH